MTHETLGKQTIHSDQNQPQVHDKVDSWNWNANIFEIYDEVRHWNSQDQTRVLTYAYDHFNKDSMIDELHSFLTGWSVEDSR